MGKALCKVDMAQHIALKLGLPESQAKSLIDLFFGEVSQVLGMSRSVKLSNFGVFELRERKARVGRNPKTGAPVLVKARRVVKFRVSPKLKKSLECPAVTSA